MTHVLLKRRNLDTEIDIQLDTAVFLFLDTEVGTTIWRHRENTAISKPRNAKDGGQTPGAGRSKEGFSPGALREGMALPIARLGLLAFQNTEAIHFCCLMPATLWLFLCYCSPSKIIPQPKLPSEIEETLACGLYPNPLGFQQRDPEMGRDLQGQMENLKSRFLPQVQFLGNCPH